MKARIGAGFIAILASVSAPGQDRQLFHCATEDSTRGWAVPAEKLANALMASGDQDDRVAVEEAIRDNDLARNHRQFLRSKPIVLSVVGPRAYFVRPSSEPHHVPFYGAHTFRFWVVGADQHVLLSSAGDQFAVLSSSHESMHDVMVSQCRAGVCYDTTLIFSNGGYHDGSCATRSLADRQTVPGCHLRDG